MVRHQASPVTGAREDSISVVGGLAVAKSRAVLPEQITGHTRGRKRGLLPRALDGAMV